MFTKCGGEGGGPPSPMVPHVQIATLTGRAAFGKNLCQTALQKFSKSKKWILHSWFFKNLPKIKYDWGKKSETVRLKFPIWTTTYIKIGEICPPNFLQIEFDLGSLPLSFQWGLKECTLVNN